MLKAQSGLAALLLGAAVLSPALSPAAQAQPFETVDLAGMTCRDFLVMDGEDRDATAVFFHGYYSGKAGETSVDIAELTEDTDAILVYCVDNPGATVMQAFAEYR